MDNRTIRSWLAWVMQGGLAGIVLVAALLASSQVSAKEIVKPVRAFHVVLLGVSPDEIKRLIDQAAGQHFNCLIVNVLWGASVRLKTFPWQVQQGKPWEPGELADVVRYARDKGMAVVPEMPLLSHQPGLLGKYRPDLMYNQRTYDPRKPAVYQLIFPMIDELIALIKPDAFHIGHDEVVGWDKSHYGTFLTEGESALPSDLFAKDVQVLHEHLAKKGVVTWMWADMLVSPDEFPSVPESSMNGSMPGYGKTLRGGLPRDIVLCDWHYGDEQGDFPSLAAIRNDGFRVLGATWENERTTRNFSRYASSHGADGMIATTWFHVGLKEWDLVDRIIRTSGAIFNADFPDAK